MGFDLNNLEDQYPEIVLEHYMFPLFKIPNNNRHSSHKRKGDNYSQDDHQ